MKRKNQISKMKSDFSFFSKKAITLVTILLPLFKTTNSLRINLETLKLDKKILIVNMMFLKQLLYDFH